MLGELNSSDAGGIPVRYWPERDLFKDIANIKLLDKMWEKPSSMAVPAGWQLPEGVTIGLSSQSPLKIDNTQEVLRSFGQDYLPCKSADEAIITKFLRPKKGPWVNQVVEDKASFASGMVRALAALKAIAAFSDNPKVTHGLGLDIDMVILGQKSLMPVGKPRNLTEFKNILRRISQKFVEIHCSADLVDPQAHRLLAFDAVNIFFKFGFFVPEQFIQAVGLEGIGQFTAGFDLSDFAVMPFLDPKVPVIVNRMDNFSPEERLGQIEREVRLNTADIPVALHEYVKGAPKAMIKSVIYNGIAHPGVFPIF